MTDMTFQLETHTFNYRVVALIAHQDRYLLTTVPENDFWFLPGGRVQLGETLSEALTRELDEELDVSGVSGQLCWLVENFFTQRGVRYHEVSGYFAVTLPPDSPCLSQSEFTLRQLEHDPDLTFRWFTCSELAELDIRPSFLKSKLGTESNRFEHLVFKDERLSSSEL
jgi:ADP-ribose pyrophosphatase YjhB (NUDIX family)